ncbi:MAG: dipeptidyl aminopeptidase, partial [Verrucomicrobia bacterium]|nr:dipeptidyl aminopeptidase [Verrucomicrobiota bacterium]
PARTGIYGDSDQPLADQWIYHAAADTILAHSLLRSRPEVDPQKVGVCGISWGGVITSTVIGIDSRWAFAIPIYGCGHLADAGNQYGRALGSNPLYREVWDPMVRLPRVQFPVLWLSWPGDQHFPLDCQAASYRAAPGPRMVALIPEMKHSHPAGWNPPDSYAFAESIVRTGRPWLRVAAQRASGGEARVEFVSTDPLDSAALLSSADPGITGARKWMATSATLERRADRWVATAPLPPGTRAWFINVRRGSLTASSDFHEISP